MDGEHNGKPYEQMDDLGGFPIFLETPISYCRWADLSILCQVWTTPLVCNGDPTWRAGCRSRIAPHRSRFTMRDSHDARETLNNELSVRGQRYVEGFLSTERLEQLRLNKMLTNHFWDKNSFNKHAVHCFFGEKSRYACHIGFPYKNTVFSRDLWWWCWSESRPWTGTSRQHQGSAVGFLREVSWKHLDTRGKKDDDDLENGWKDDYHIYAGAVQDRKID